ncbi:glycine-rich domain-containing protein [Streptomyces virginiae]
MTITQSSPEAALALVSPDLRAALIRDVRKEWAELTDEQGERGVDQTVAYLVACSATPGLAPSKLVDRFWHAFLKRTRSYRTFCDLVAGRYLDHEPDETPVPKEEKEEGRRRTLTAIREAGFTVDAEFWPPVMADCSQCHAGCTDSPNGGK